MPKTDEGQPHKSNTRSSSEGDSRQDRMVTTDERTDLVEDAKAFKRSHKKTFQILSESEGDE